MFVRRKIPSRAAGNSIKSTIKEDFKNGTNWKEDHNLIRKLAKILLGDTLPNGKPVSSIILLDDTARAELQRWANMSDAEFVAAQLSGDSIHIDVDDVIRQLEEKYALDPQLLDELLSVFDADDLELLEEISRWEDSDHDEPTEYFFSNPDPYFKPEPLPPDRPRHNFWFDETGHIRVKNPSAFWLPEFTLQREIGGTIYTITGAMTGQKRWIERWSAFWLKSLQKIRRMMNDKYRESW